MPIWARFFSLSFSSFSFFLLWREKENLREWIFGFCQRDTRHESLFVTLKTWESPLFEKENFFFFAAVQKPFFYIKALHCLFIWIRSHTTKNKKGAKVRRWRDLTRPFPFSLVFHFSVVVSWHSPHLSNTGTHKKKCFHFVSRKENLFPWNQPNTHIKNEKKRKSLLWHAFFSVVRRIDRREKGVNFLREILGDVCVQFKQWGGEVRKETDTKDLNSFLVCFSFDPSQNLFFVRTTVSAYAIWQKSKRVKRETNHTHSVVFEQCKLYFKKTLDLKLGKITHWT